MLDEKVVTAESASALGEAIASSPEAQEEIEGQAQETQTPAKEEVTQEQESRVPYSRLKEVVDEKNFWREKAMQQQPQPQQPQQPTQDPYAGMTADEEKFFRLIDARADKIAEQRMRQLSPVIDAGRQELAQMKVQQFRNSHPDVKPNSPEEIAIAQKISNGYLPEDAYKVVMWENKVSQATKQENIVTKQKLEAKKQANVENRSTSSGVNTHAKETLSLKERIRREADKLDWS